MSHSKETPFYLQMVALLQKAITLLDEQGRKEVLHFSLQNQNEEGGFCDRGGRSDLYYSLFGLLILKAMDKTADSKDQEESFLPKAEVEKVARSLLLLKQYTDEQKPTEVDGFIEICCLVLLQKELKSKGSLRFQALWSLGKSFWKERSSINLSYRSFVLFLTLDAVFPFSAALKIPACRMMGQTTVSENSPCSEVAAKVFLNRMMNQNNLAELKLLGTFACHSGGFRAFNHLEHADMLSTAVALFALNYAGADLRLLKPSALDFIQSNYSSGAFLSGDGDLSADVEYTFYGLLALGVLSN